VSDTLRHTPEGVFLGHMLEVDHGTHNDTPAGAEYEKALAREIFGECWAIEIVSWVLAIQALVELVSRRKWHFKLWHVYSKEMLNVK
jgi:hypothetical protein